MKAQILDAVRRYAAMDPAAWDTGLSPAGARRGLAEACALVLASRLSHAELPPGARPPERLVIWCASTVFTAPLEWVALFRALGSRVTLKAPAAAADPLRALARAFGDGVEVLEGDHAAALAALPGFNAVLGFGSDAAMEALQSRLPPHVPRSLHGHRVSFAVVEDPAHAGRLALDAALYDGQGCMSPAAVFCTGDAASLAEALAAAMERTERELPRGPLHPALGPEWRRRAGLARVRGRLWGGGAWAVGLLPPGEALAASLPRFLMVHPIESVADLAGLKALPLSTCGTDLSDPAALLSLGFWRVCPPGQMQRPPAGRPHDGVDLLRTLCRFASVEL